MRAAPHAVMDMAMGATIHSHGTALRCTVKAPRCWNSTELDSITTALVTRMRAMEALRDTTGAMRATARGCCAYVGPV